MIIEPNLRDQQDIRNSLQRYVASQDPDKRWKDFYAGSAGQIVLDLIAALGAFDAHNSAMVLREASLSTAVLDSSIREHAFNRGIIEGPTGTLVLVFNIQVSGGSRVLIGEGDLVGRIGDYDLYALENVDTTTSFSMRVAAGFLEEVSQPVTARPFSQISFDLERKFIAPQLEQFLIDGVEISLRSDPGDLTNQGTDFVIRHVTPNLCRIYLGNGILGWYNPNATQLTYRYLNYDTDLATVEGNRPSIQIANGRLVSYTVESRPVYGVSGEELRGLTLYYPIDGRIVKDEDYAGIIMRDYGGVLYDVYSFNTDPEQHVQLLTSPEYSSAFHLPKIKALIEGKRGPGIPVIYTEVPASAGLTFNVEFQVPKGDYDAYLAIRSDVLAYVNRQRFKIARAATVISSERLAVDLTQRFGLRFYPTANVSFTIPTGSFLAQFNVAVQYI